MGRWCRVLGGVLTLTLLNSCPGWDYEEWCGPPDVGPDGRIVQHGVLVRYRGQRAGLFGEGDYLFHIGFEDDSVYFFVYEPVRFRQRVRMAWGCAADLPRGASPGRCDLGVPGILYGGTRAYLGARGSIFSLCENDERWNPPGCVVFSFRDRFPYVVIDTVVWGVVTFFPSPGGRWEVSSDSSGLRLTRLSGGFRAFLDFPAFRGDIAWSPSEDTFCIGHVLYRYTGASVETLRVYADTLRCSTWGPGPDAITVILESGNRFFWMNLDGWAWGSVPEWTYEPERPVERIRWVYTVSDTFLVVDRRIIHPGEGVVRKLLGPGCTGAPPNR